jgi:hypothetical protein
MSKNGPIAKITGSIMGNGSANVMGDHLPETDAQAKLIFIKLWKTLREDRNADQFSVWRPFFNNTIVAFLDSGHELSWARMTIYF